MITDKTEQDLRTELLTDERKADSRINRIFDVLALAIVSNSLVKIYCGQKRVTPIPPATTRQITVIINNHLTMIARAVQLRVSEAWKIGEMISSAEVAAKVTKTLISDAHKRGLFAHREKAMNEYLNRKIKGITLSQRVWNLQPVIRSQIEQTLQLGIIDGCSAIEIARDLKKYLREPDKLFRRVRDAEGKLRLSRPAQAYNPGTGVYRSAYKNALRLSRNEINKAYREAEYVQRQELPFVVGIEIHTSNNHPTPDICDVLAGRYPKSFKWSGWHTQCRCFATSILKAEEEIAADNCKILNGEPLTGESRNRVTEYPHKLTQWAEENRDRYKGSAVDWINDNAQVQTLFK